jgi:hypothetical protein
VSLQFDETEQVREVVRVIPVHYSQTGYHILPYTLAQNRSIIAVTGSKAHAVFCHLIICFVGSNPTRGMHEWRHCLLFLLP